MLTAILYGATSYAKTELFAQNKIVNVEKFKKMWYTLNESK